MLLTKTKIIQGWSVIGLFFILFSCQNQQEKSEILVRSMVDSIGFATSAIQMDSIIQRIERGNQRVVFKDEDTEIMPGQWKTVICPHDDYAYAGFLYPAVLASNTSRVIFLFGVAHKASNYDLKDKIIFGDFDYWSSAYGEIKVSGLREKVKNALPAESYVVHREMVAVEHSLEAILPFLQKYNSDFEIVPVLIPYMKYEQMEKVANYFAHAIYEELVVKEGYSWGSDFSLVISNDAVHYGDKDWGGKDMAPFGADSAGYSKAIDKESEIAEVLTGELNIDRIKKFTELTVREEDYTQYKWTWCGRYSIPFGLLVTHKLSQQANGKPVEGILQGYSTSIASEPVKVDDIEMGNTAPANIRHWVGYAAIGYK